MKNDVVDRSKVQKADNAQDLTAPITANPRAANALDARALAVPGPEIWLHSLGLSANNA